MRFELVISQLIMRSWVEVEGDLKEGVAETILTFPSHRYASWEIIRGERARFIFSGKN